MKFKYLSLALFFLTTGYFAQTSLYSGKNPYTKNFQTGDVINVKVNNNFSFVFSGDWNENFEATLKLQPDQKNLSFLSPSEQTSVNQRKQKSRQNTAGKLTFNLSGVLTRQADGRLFIDASKLIQMDGKVTQVNCTGIVNEKKIENGSLGSDDIADLRLTIITKPPIPLDTSINENEPPKNLNNETPEGEILSKEQIRKYVIKYLQQILGALQ